MLFSKWNSKGKHGEIEMTSAFSTSPIFIHRFELLKLACKKILKIKKEKNNNKSSLCSQTYS